MPGITLVLDSLSDGTGPFPVITIDLPAVRAIGAEKVLGALHDVMGFTRRGMAVGYSFRKVQILWGQRKPNEPEHACIPQEYVVPLHWIACDSYFGDIAPGAKPDWVKLARDRELPEITSDEMGD